MSIDQHMEELRSELRNAVYRDERRETEAALELALAEREVICAEQVSSSPATMLVAARLQAVTLHAFAAQQLQEELYGGLLFVEMMLHRLPTRADAPHLRVKQTSSNSVASIDMA